MYTLRSLERRFPFHYDKPYSYSTIRWPWTTISLTSLFLRVKKIILFWGFFCFSSHYNQLIAHNRLTDWLRIPKKRLHTSPSAGYHGNRRVPPPPAEWEQHPANGHKSDDYHGKGSYFATVPMEMSPKQKQVSTTIYNMLHYKVVCLHRAHVYVHRASQVCKAYK